MKFRKVLGLSLGFLGLLIPGLAQASDQANRNDYIVVFRDDASPKAEIAAVASLGGRIFFTYDAALQGVAVNLPSAAIEGLRNRPGIESVELDGLVMTQDSQQGATWGLDRIDQRDLPLNGTYNFDFTGTYGSTNRVDAYIIDTGIRSDHKEFVGRIAKGYTAINDRRGTEDCNGHGTHVAGTVGGTTYGVAKQVRLTPVRVLDCRGSGSWSGVVAGIDWVVRQHASGVPAVANMSLGGSASSSIDSAVASLVADGVTVVVAAGNSNVDACTTSPARTPSAVTVGATTSNDSRASFSNFGTCLDIFAPGTSITSAWSTSSTATNTISGTSMASPHVAGVVALLLAEGQTDPVSILIGRATVGKVIGGGTGSPDRLLYSLRN
jgi:aqualysin 1